MSQVRGAEPAKIGRKPIPAQSRSTRPSPRHPARHVINGMAGLLARGSQHLAAFPTCRFATDISGIGQALAAYSCGGSRGFVSEHRRARFVPHSLIALSHERGHQGVQYTVAPSHCQWRVSRRRPTRRVRSRRNSTIVAAGVIAYAAAVDRCSVPTALSRRVKREAGASARVERSIPALPPQR
jgi:hypothetical protein